MSLSSSFKQLTRKSFFTRPDRNLFHCMDLSGFPICSKTLQKRAWLAEEYDLNPIGGIKCRTFYPAWGPFDFKGFQVMPGFYRQKNSSQRTLCRCSIFLSYVKKAIDPLYSSIILKRLKEFCLEISRFILTKDGSIRPMAIFY